jgi:O-methyltransferase
MRTDLNASEYDYGTGIYPIRPNGFFDQILETLFRGCQYVYGFDVVGDIAEFGTMTGKTAGLLAHAVRVSDVQFEKNLRLAGLPVKNLHLFDSFKGLPSSESSAVDALSPHVLSKIWREGALIGLSAEQLAAHIGVILDEERIFIHEGWFSETMPQLDTEARFALVHIDCDLYSSTVDVLDQLFSRGMLSEGAMVLFDDWNCNKASNAFGERRAWTESVEKYQVQFSDEGSYGWASHKFIIHGYLRP